MAKKLILLLSLILWADTFEQACVPCHQRRAVPLKPIFFDYLLYYSSERGVKKAMRDFLLHPDPKKRLYKKGPIHRHRFDPKTLQKALDEYWERYKVIGKIK